MPKYLGQVVAIEADVRRTAMRSLTDAYHGLDKPVLLEGLRKDYAPLVEDGEQLPSEGTRVQTTVEEMIDTSRTVLARLFDITAARDYTNSAGHAKADVVVGETKLIEGAPMPYLLWLDRQLDHLAAFVERIPTHSPATTWSEHEARGVYASEPVKTARQIQQPRVITLAAATDKHQAQTQLISEQVNVGVWTRVNYSGAAPVARKEGLLRRIATLRHAVAVAKGEVNRSEAVEPVIGEKVLGYLFDA
ncbi:MAG TPA: hypothetical protein VK735_32590 [Pseudonocardia sp.]|uniref:DUF7873 family protein n=1 Tax=Pseudonocardia sp. TaxID=60912 RepID=UPI002CCD6C17|nr:hypothetical protein [Pseudonocardia sp.]HTF52207.1 hypothetical protein [Pseudonocardia sp.]